MSIELISFVLLLAESFLSIGGPRTYKPANVHVQICLNGSPDFIHVQIKNYGSKNEVMRIYKSETNKDINMINA